MGKNENNKFWEENNTWIVGLAGAAAIVGIGYFLLTRKKHPWEKTDDVFKCISKSYPLDYGTCHKDVGVLQKFLVSRGYDLGMSGRQANGVDNQFGMKTENAAKEEFGKISFTKSDINELKERRTLETH